MRLRKQIILWGEDDDRVGELSLILATRMYVTVTKCTSALFIRTLREVDDPHLIILLDNGNQEHIEAIGAIANEFNLCPLMLILDSKAAPPAIYVESTVRREAPMADLLERVHILTCRKRGPRGARELPSLAEVA